MSKRKITSSTDSGDDMQTTKVRVTTPMPEGKAPIVWHLELMTANPAEAIRWTKAAPQVLPHATVEVVEQAAA
ncbi:hypothetical protein AB8B21_07285 [Tardiphaga sp. 866_E4_N2_1]|uniref:hypothetical protein n=1 Tax=unclassified Tardiphaga TaxID=2631404 RepID=UPI003F2773C2